ncbi:MAG: phosphoribosylaminoimidazolesuccinocarboxamide synthase [Acidobacteria bacterium]|nr:MAG: phosphoribosylaminoimidazolesuccinocarboxamide synthase [Acidobacteriota bacterium]
MNGLSETSLPGLPRVGRGKVRDIYDLGDALLFVCTDRISAFDVVLPQPIPDKGRVLNQLSAFWLEWSRPLVANHLVTARFDEFPAELRRFGDQLAGRASIVRKADMFPVECVARGYLAGSGWKEYRERGTVCGIELPPGLREADRLPEPIFTPATKAESGHDENIPFERMASLVGRETADRLRSLTLELYARAAEYAAERGIIIADTKFEFGVIDGRIALCDEALTPDSSRFWPRDGYEPGRPQPSYDKQFVRDYLETLDWDKKPPGPDLPPEIVEGTRRRYIEIFEILTGRSLA